MGDSEFACSVPSVVNELKGGRLGDVRLEKRVVNIVERLSASPGESLPDALQTDAELEGFYRLVGNERVSYNALISAHIAQTVERVVAVGTALAIHDTTECAFSGEKKRTGLGPLKDGKQGFLAHVTLAVGAQEGNMPLGVVGIECWARKEEKKPKKKGKKKMSGSDYAGIADKESARWRRQVDAVEEAVGGRASLVHVMDREGDAYPLLCGMAESAMRFVVRLARERSVWEVDEEGMALDDEDPIRMSEALLELPIRVEREVTLSTRRQSSMPRQERSHPGRQMRAATLGIGARRLALRRPKYLAELPDALEANIVYVREIEPPAGSDPVAWVLVTGEPIDTREQIEAIVDAYRARWIIEEYFKALKTGCVYETRQLESFESLTNTLSLFLPIAWQMLRLRAMSRLTPNAPAETVLNPTQIAILQQKQPKKMPVSGATVRDALYAVAGLGGHLKNNGPPGWQTLARGTQALLLLEAGWNAAIEKDRKTTPKM